MSDYRPTMKKVLAMIEAAYIAASEPAPHPVRWKRWLRRPYRTVDSGKFMVELHERRNVSRAAGVSRD